MRRNGAGRMNSKTNRSKDAETLEDEVEFYSCPGGHKLPNRTNQGVCTPIFCATDANEVPLIKKKRKAEYEAKKAAGLAIREIADREEMDKSAPDEIIDVALPPTDDSSIVKSARMAAQLEKADEIRRSGMRIGQFATRMALMKAPTNLEGAEAEQWADREMTKYLPIAVATIGHDLKYGDQKERAEAARAVLDATGRAKRESLGGGQPLLILNFGGQATLPWSQKGTVIEGKVVSAQKPDGEGAGGKTGTGSDPTGS